MRALLSGTLVLVAVSVGLAACAGSAPPAGFTKEDAAQIRQMVDDFTTAYNAKDIEKVASFFSGNATIMPPNRSTLRGVELVKTYYQGRLMDEGATDLAFDDVTLDGESDLAYAAATYRLMLRPQGGPEERFRGKNVWILRKLGGQWRIELQIFSSDLPPAAPPAAAAN